MGWSWAQRATVSLVVVAAAGGALTTVGAVPALAEDASVPIVVQTNPGAIGSVATAVQALGGTVGQRMWLINGFAAQIPMRAASAVAGLPGVTAVSPDRTVRLLSDDPPTDDPATAAATGGPAPADAATTDPTPTESTPTESTPTESTPTESTPADSTPADSTPADSAPPETTPADSASAAPTADSATADSATADSARADPATADSAPVDSGPPPPLLPMAAVLAAPAPIAAPVSMAATIDATGASAYRSRGFDGAGVDIALIDSGVSRVPGLDEPGVVVDGPDFTRDAADPASAHRDLFGHGTHMAGIIVGGDRRVTDGFSGVAPGAHLVNVKVADREGRSSTSQVIAAIGWVVSHQHAAGLNIRVLNLSFGTVGGADPALDPLDQAVEAAWRHGITVIVAAGNRGASSGHLSNPARDPLVIAVGASDSASRASESDVTLDFSSHGDGSRNPDLVAPGRSVLSLRDPMSFIDATYPSARVGDDLFRGSGTSQAAAIVSGAVALVLEQHPDASPDQIKALLDATAAPIPHGGDATAQGNGLVNLAGAIDAAVGNAGPPPLDTVVQDALVSLLGGDVIIPLTTRTAHGSSLSGSSWSDGEWSGSSWS